MLLRAVVGEGKKVLVEQLGETERRRGGGVGGIGVDGFGGVVGVRNCSVGGGLASEGGSGGAENIGAGVDGAVGRARKAPAYGRKPGGKTVPPSSLRRLFRIVFVGGQKENPPDR